MISDGTEVSFVKGVEAVFTKVSYWHIIIMFKGARYSVAKEGACDINLTLLGTMKVTFIDDMKFRIQNLTCNVSNS